MVAPVTMAGEKGEGKEVMKEITRVIDAKITIIESLTDEDADLIVSVKADAEENVKETLKGLYEADDIQVEIHDFVMDGQTE